MFCCHSASTFLAWADLPFVGRRTFVRTRVSTVITTWEMVRTFANVRGVAYWWTILGLTAENLVAFEGFLFDMLVGFLLQVQLGHFPAALGVHCIQIRPLLPCYVLLE